MVVVVVGFVFLTDRFREGNMSKFSFLKCKELAGGLWVKDLLFLKNKEGMCPSFPTESCQVSTDEMPRAVVIP